MYTFTNQFSGPTLRQRVAMINSHRSRLSSGWRYLIWAVVMSGMGLACRHKDNSPKLTESRSFLQTNLPAINPSRGVVATLEDEGHWYRHLALYQTRTGTQVVQGEPVVLQVKNNHFLLPDDYKYSSEVYINGETALPEVLQKLSPEFVKEVFVLRRMESLTEGKNQAKPYQIIIQTSSQPVRFNDSRNRFFTLLQAAAISQYPLGESFSFNMNQLLEATFFHNKNALVERTKDEHLKVYDEFANEVEISINNLPATPADVKTVHVREVARLYTKELPYVDWFRADNPSPRFKLFIQTSPKRAKRDSSYYVFSPFYTGDF